MTTPTTTPRRRRSTSKATDNGQATDQAKTSGELVSQRPAPAAEKVTVDEKVTDATNATILPSKADYLASRNAYEGAGVASAEMLEKIVNAKAYSTYVTRPDNAPAGPEDLFSDYLGDTLTLPGKSEARNRIVMALVEQGKSQPKIAAMLNVTRPAVQYIVNKANNTLPPSQNGTPAIESGEGTGDGDTKPGKPEKTPQEKINAAVASLLKMARELPDDDRTELLTQLRVASKTILAMDNATDDAE